MISRHRGSLNIWCALIGIAATCCLADGTADHHDVAAGQPAAAPEVSKRSKAGVIAAVKTALVEPQVAPGVTTDGPPPDESAIPAVATGSEYGTVHTVNLVASPQSPWAGKPTTLTATTNFDVGPTGHRIRIWDDDHGVDIKSCSTGTTCAVTVTRPGMRTTSFKAVVELASGIPLVWASTSVYWHLAGVRLAESETTVPTGRSVMLTAFTDYNIAGTGYRVQIYDDTTRTFLYGCDSGTMCSVTVRQDMATTHGYRAYFSGNGTSYPPPNLMERTMQKFVTWTGNPAIRVFLQQPSPDTVTATASIDVTTTPYYIQIYNFDGNRIAACRGTSCTAVTNACCGDDHLIAFVGPLSSTAVTAIGAAQAISRVFSPPSPGPSGNSVTPCPTPRPGDISMRPFP